MTETPKAERALSPETIKRREAKALAQNCFFKKGNSLLLIAAVLLPVIIYVVAQGLYSMVYFAVDPQETNTWIAEASYIVDLILGFLMLPLAGGTLYVVTGLAAGEERQLRDIFYAYSSWRAHIRTWFVMWILLLAISATAGIAATILMSAQGLSEMASTVLEQSRYAFAIYDGGLALAALIGLFGLLLCMYLLPLLWLVFRYPNRSFASLMAQSIQAVRGRLMAWIVFQISFIGWLLLSVATVGIVLVLFAAPYYLLAVAFYIEKSSLGKPEILKSLD